MNLFAKLFVALHVGIYRLTGGVIGGNMGFQVLLLTTTGRKSGKSRTVTLGLFEDGGELLVTATAGGSQVHPAWYNNLVANPTVTVQRGRRVFRATAEPTTGEERKRLWAAIVAQAPQFAGYEKKATPREIPVVRFRELSPG